MKKFFINIAICLIIIFIVNACNDGPLSGNYLEKPAGSDVTIDTIFSTKERAETLLWETYATSVPMGFPYNWDATIGGMYASMEMAATDEGDIYDGWPGGNSFNTGSLSPTSNQEDTFGRHYKGIRNANIFIKNIDRVTDVSAAEKERMKAEAWFLRAFEHYALFKRYGGIPIVDHVLSATGEIKLPRNTVAETIDFIVSYCDSAAAILPDQYPSRYRGRATKGAALALKARTLLYAASPLFNTNTPYLSSGNPELISYPSYEESRWQKAADASKAVLDWAESTGVIELVRGHGTAKENYEYIFTEPDNSEIILANKSQGWWGVWSPMFSQFAMPRGIYGGWYGHGVTLNFAQKYYKSDGTSQIWPDSGPESEFLTKMQEMGPRFQASVFYSGAKWNDEIGVRKFYTRSDGSNSAHYPVNGVGYMRKFLSGFTWSGDQLNWPVFRLAEFYLNYAEALNEVSPLNTRVYQALNEIRDRAGLPDILSTDPRYDTQEELRQAIRRERAIEFAFEEHRLIDVRRWRIAGNEGVMSGSMYGLNLYEQDDGSLNYKKEVFEERIWDDRMYLYPIPQEEINKGYIVQNPGW